MMPLRNIRGPVSLALSAAAFLAANVPASASANENHNCYPTSADSDGDGYANKGTKAVVKSISTLHCPSGYVDKAGDCNDGDATIHPRRYEVAGNNVDDDCDTKVDEPEIKYPSNVWNNGWWNVWTVEGNCGNEVCISTEPLNATMVGEGVITGRKNMLDSWLY